MDYNYTLKYRTFDQLLEDVTVDLNSFALENMIEPQQLIKLVKKLNYDLGLRINQTREVILEVCHGKVKLPDNFYTVNYAMICGSYTSTVGYPHGGTNIQEVPYVEVPSTVNTCAPDTINCRTCNANPCNHTAACDLNHPIVNPIPDHYDPDNPYGDTCIPPRVFMNCKGDKYELIQVVGTTSYNTYTSMIPLRLKASQEIDCECPNLYYNGDNEGWIKNGYLFTTFQDGKVYLNYQGLMENEQGQLLVPDHDLINEYYEYALKMRIMENLYLNGEDVAQRMQLLEQRLKASRNQALSLVNTPNFKEMEKLWWTNRRAQYFKYYDMFKSYQGYNGYYGNFGRNRVL
jgi:hypothetical protein